MTRVTLTLALSFVSDTLRIRGDVLKSSHFWFALYRQTRKKYSASWRLLESEGRMAYKHFNYYIWSKCPEYAAGTEDKCCFPQGFLMLKKITIVTAKGIGATRNWLLSQYSENITNPRCARMRTCFIIGLCLAQPVLMDPFYVLVHLNITNAIFDSVRSVLCFWNSLSNT